MIIEFYLATFPDKQEKDCLCRTRMTPSFWIFDFYGTDCRSDFNYWYSYLENIFRFTDQFFRQYSSRYNKIRILTRPAVNLKNNRQKYPNSNKTRIWTLKERIRLVGLFWGFTVYLIKTGSWTQQNKVQRCIARKINWFWEAWKIVLFSDWQIGVSLIIIQ